MVQLEPSIYVIEEFLTVKGQVRKTVGVYGSGLIRNECSLVKLVGQSDGRADTGGNMTIVG